MLRFQYSWENFKRFIFCLTLFKIESKEEIFDSITNKIKILGYLKSISRLKHYEYLINIYYYEFEIYQLVVSNIDNYINILDERVTTLSRVRKIIESEKANILDQNLKVNRENKLINSKYNWTLFLNLNEENFYSIVKNNQLDNYSILIRTSIIDDVYFDETVLDFELKLLIEILKLDGSINGNEIVDAIINEIDDKVNPLIIKEKIRFEITNALLFYLVYFNALKII